ncbi:hypothetical protein SAMN04487996_101123 [Dyadobacter soli]|uniref:Uncharacterized protein n=1 Tax=Dyadobacter soli TaxID=659014 RepID=A0A1G6V3B7_9BACT|nr:hypothetical protein SAMN04487996_101123 [Dyadobacter soli]
MGGKIIKKMRGSAGIFSEKGCGICKVSYSQYYQLLRLYV